MGGESSKSGRSSSRGQTPLPPPPRPTPASSPPSAASRVVALHGDDWNDGSSSSSASSLPVPPSSSAVAAATPIQLSPPPPRPAAADSPGAATAVTVTTIAGNGELNPRTAMTIGYTERYGQRFDACEMGSPWFVTHDLYTTATQEIKHPSISSSSSKGYIYVTDPNAECVCVIDGKHTSLRLHLSHAGQYSVTIHKPQE